MSEDEAICRNCHEAGGDLIKPCACTGSLKWVHRDCLNMWRSVSPNPKSFSHCDICGQAYYMRRKKLGAGPYVKMILGMIRDISLVLLAITVLIVIPGAIIYYVETEALFMEEITSDADTLKVIANPAFDIFVLGAAFDCFIIGCCAIVYAILRCLNAACSALCCCPVGSAATTYYTYNTYHYHTIVPAWWWWYVFLSPPRGIGPCCCYCHTPYSYHHSSCSSCNCVDCCDACCNNSCDCNSSSGDCGDAGSALIIALIVIVVIIIIIGFIVGVVMLGILTARIIHNHVTILQKQKEAQELEVIDLSHGLAKDDSSIIVLNDNYDFVSPYATNGSGYVAPGAGMKGQEEEGPWSVLASLNPPEMVAGAGPSAPPPPDACGQMPYQCAPLDPNAGVSGPSVPPTY